MKFWNWFTKKVDNARKRIYDVVDSIEDLVAQAEPIVARLDDYKTKVATSTGIIPVAKQIAKDFKLDDKEADKVVTMAIGMPINDFLANVATLLLQRLVGTAATSAIRLAVELAYQLYKASKSQ